MDGAAVDFGAILADFELAFDARDGDAEADDAGEHCSAEAIGETAPLFGIGGFVGFNQAGEKRVFACIVFNELECAVGVDGDVVPCGDGQLLGIEARD